jgi:hypothetical protein
MGASPMLYVFMKHGFLLETVWLGFDCELVDPLLLVPLCRGKWVFVAPFVS